MPMTKRPQSRSGSSAAATAIVPRPAACAQQMAQRRRQRRLGEAAESAHLLFERPGPGELGSGGQRVRRGAWRRAGAPSPPRCLRRDRRASPPRRRSRQKAGRRLRAARRARKAHSLTAAPLRNGLLPKIAASRRSPGGRRAPGAGGLGRRIVPGRRERRMPGREAEVAPPPIGRKRRPVAFYRRGIGIDQFRG